MKRLTTKAQERLSEMLSRAFEIYNGFAVGQEGERILLELRDAVKARLDSENNGAEKMKLELPMTVVGYMMAASKHLGDMCNELSQMDKAGQLFR